MNNYYFFNNIIKMGGAQIAALIIVIILVLIVLGVGMYFALSGSSSSGGGGGYTGGTPLDNGSGYVPPGNSGTPPSNSGGGGGGYNFTAPISQADAKGIQFIDSKNSTNQWGWTKNEAMKLSSGAGGRMASKAEVEASGHMAGKDVMTSDFIGRYLGGGQWDANNKAMSNWNDSVRKSWYFIGKQLTSQDIAYFRSNSAAPI